MNAREEKSLVKWFGEYVRQFAGKNGKLPTMLKIKLDHSRRVAGYTAAIGQDLGFSEGDVRAARILGLFHDIGRFSQFTEHQTFRDNLSFNHGHRGANIMEKCPALAACSAGDRRRIIAGIYHHNSANLPDRLDPDAMQFVKLARDADKLDIFFILHSSWKNGDLLKSPDIVLRIKLEGPVNPRTLDEIRNKQPVSLANVKSLADIFLLQLSWTYDLNFRPSYRRLIARKVIDNIAAALPATAEIKEQIAAAKKYAQEQLVKTKK